jgi:hypothetical protein
MLAFRHFVGKLRVAYLFTKLLAYQTFDLSGFRIFRVKFVQLGQHFGIEHGRSQIVIVDKDTSCKRVVFTFIFGELQCKGAVSRPLFVLL